MPTISGLSLAIASTIVPGDIVGEHPVPGGLEVGDTLLSVIQVTDGSPPTSVNRTAEFTVSTTKAGVMVNTTTNTTGTFLAVTWLKAN